MNNAAAPAIQIERPVITIEDGRSFDGIWPDPRTDVALASSSSARCGASRRPRPRWRRTTRSAAGVPTHPTCFGARNSPVSCRSRRQTRPGGGSTPSTGSARLMMPELRWSGCWTQASSSGRVAAIGFCMGGRTAFLAASRGGVDASISLYALGIAKHLDELRMITTPLQLHYGLNDEHIPKSEIDAVIAAAKGNRNVEVHLYPGAEHGFFTKGRAGVQRRGGRSCHRTYRAIALNIELAARQLAFTLGRDARRSER